MGACISIHHKASAMKVQVPFDSGIKPDHTSLIHPSPSAPKLSAMDQHVAAVVKPQLHVDQSHVTFPDHGSKEETFFDSQAWLDSDYEDEFMSVNGEFTPSRGNTPVHHTLTHKTPRTNEGSTITDPNEPLSSTSPTPIEKRRRLLDLFKESIREKHGSNLEGAVEPSIKDGKMGSDQDGLQPKNESHVGSKQGCFKSLISVRSIGKLKSLSSSPSPNRDLRGNPVVG
ncbi:hypothetical protein QVD17_18536 [Tagetes erecta]|uniref:Uncharacterized protein n=1 Tax=Tagetes erecta TaxID=13708 RepID=A0AAD8KHZ1_TARER|nr:hypothetical protein QVD17_18536 [Tagetes erecta]